MSKRKKRPLSIVAVLIEIILILLVMLSVASNVLFYDENFAPEFMGNSYFIMNNDEMQNIPKGTLVISKLDDFDNIKPGRAVLCSIGNGKKTILGLVNVETRETGESLYLVKGGMENSILSYTLPKKQILAHSIKQSQEAGTMITFAKTKPGIILLIISPLIIVIIMSIARIIGNRKFNSMIECEEDEKKEKVNSEVIPLFEAGEETNKSKEFISKKASIAENFANKNVNRENNKDENQFSKNKEKTSTDIKTKNEQSNKAKREATFTNINWNDVSKVNKDIEKIPEEEFAFKNDKLEKMINEKNSKLTYNYDTIADKIAKDSKDEEKITESIKQVEQRNFTANEIIDQVSDEMKYVPENRVYKPKPKVKNETSTINNETIQVSPQNVIPEKSKPVENDYELEKIKTEPKKATNKPRPKSKLSASSFDDLLKVIDAEKKKLD